MLTCALLTKGCFPGICQSWSSSASLHLSTVLSRLLTKLALLIRLEVFIYFVGNGMQDKCHSLTFVFLEYSVRFWAESDPDNKQVIDVPAEEFNCTKTDLNASTHYGVDVQAFTKMGPGPRVEDRFESGVPPGIFFLH